MAWSDQSVPIPRIVPDSPAESNPASAFFDAYHQQQLAARQQLAAQDAHQQAVQQAQMYQLEMQKKQAELAPVHVFLNTAKGIKSAADAGLIDGDKAQNWFLKNATTQIQTPQQAAAFGSAMDYFKQSGPPALGSGFSGRQPSAPPSAPSEPSSGASDDSSGVDVIMSPRQWELWKGIATRAPTLAEQLEAAKIKATTGLQGAQYRADKGLEGSQARANATIEAARLRASSPQAMASTNRVNEMANSAYDRTIGPYEQAVDRSDRLGKILAGIALPEGDPKHIVPTKSVLTQAAQDLNFLQTNKSTIWGSRGSQVPSQLLGDANAWLTYFGGGPKPASSEANLDQVSREIGALREEVGDEHSRRFQSFLERRSDPAIRSNLINGYNQFRQRAFGGAGRVAPEGPPPPPPPMAPRIHVIDDKGKNWTIPASQWDEAQKQGYTKAGD